MLRATAAVGLLAATAQAAVYFKEEFGGMFEKNMGSLYSMEGKPRELKSVQRPFVQGANRHGPLVSIDFVFSG